MLIMKEDVKGFLRKSILYYTIIASASLMFFIRLRKNGIGWEFRWCKRWLHDLESHQEIWGLVKCPDVFKIFSKIQHLLWKANCSYICLDDTLAQYKPGHTYNWNGWSIIHPKALIIPLPEWFVSLRKSVSVLSPLIFPWLAPQLFQLST